MNKGIFLAASILMFSPVLSATASESDEITFDARAGGGVYSHGRGGAVSTGGVVDVSGVIVIGDADRSNVSAEVALRTAIRNGGADVVEADVALKARYLKEGRFGVEVRGLPFRYRADDNYYELSLVEVSAVAKLAEKGGHQLLALGGINPYTKRTYGNDYGTTTTKDEPVQADAGYHYRPWLSQVYGAPLHAHDPDADGTYADNRFVYFGGGTMTRTVETSFDTSERTIRFPISLEYKYRSGDQKLRISAVAYYALRAGKDSLHQNDDYSDRYDGRVAYSNVRWQDCYDASTDSTYGCSPYNVYYEGQGAIFERYRNSTELQSTDYFVAHTVGGKGHVNYSVYQGSALELLVNGEVRAEYDTHVMDGAIGTATTSKRFIGTAGATVRF